MGANFAQLIPGTIPRQRPRWIDAGGNDDVEMMGEMIQHKQYAGMNRRILNRVVIVQNEHEGPFLPDKLVDQEGGNGIVGQLLRGVEPIQRRFTKIFPTGLAGSD